MARLVPPQLDQQTKASLNRLVRTKSTPPKTRLRARIILLAANGFSQAEIARKLLTSPSTVKDWLGRFHQHGLDALARDRIRSGRPRHITPEVKDKVAYDTLCMLPPSGVRWTVRSMAAYQGLPSATIQRIWVERGIDPRQIPTSHVTNLTAADIKAVRKTASGYGPKFPRLLGADDPCGVVLGMRPTGVPAELRAGYSVFEGLLAELLVRGSRNPPKDVWKMLRELHDAATQKCARTTVAAWEYGRIVATMAYAGPGTIDPGDEHLRVLWPPMLPHQRMPVLAMAMLVQNGLMKLAKDRSDAGVGLRARLRATGKGWPVEVTGVGSGRPRNEVHRGAYVMGVRERLFDDHAEVLGFVEATRVIASATGVKERTVRREMKRERSERWSVPETWKTTLLAQRLAPLHADFPIEGLASANNK